MVQIAELSDRRPVLPGDARQCLAFAHFVDRQSGFVSRTSGLSKDIEVICDVLALEVEQLCRINGDATYPSLEVQVRARATASISSQTDWLSRFHVLVLCY